MKKFLLPIALFLLFLLFPLNISAQSATYQNQLAKDKCVGKKYNECNQKFKSDVCLPLQKDYVAWAACHDDLADQIEACGKEIDSEYPPCKEVQIYESQSPRQGRSESNQPEPEQQEGTGKNESPQIPFPQKPEQPEKSAKEINDWINDTFGDVDFERTIKGPALERAPVIDELPSPALEKARADSPYSAGILKKDGNTRAQIQFPGTKKFVSMEPGKIPLGSVVKSGDDTIYLYDDAVGLIILPPGAEMTILDTNLPVPVYLEKGTVEVKKDSMSSSAKSPGIGTEFVEIDVIGTHYWVSHEPGKQTLIGVYEGEVEVKTKNGKTTTVSPNGGKPGIAVVSQKLSSIKLAAVGLVLAAIIGGVVFFLKKRNRKVLTSRKKTSKKT